MTQSDFLNQHQDLLTNWNNIVAYKANPNDPRWANDPNIKELAQFNSLSDYLTHMNGGQAFDPAPAGSGTDTTIQPAVTPSTVPTPVDTTAGSAGFSQLNPTVTPATATGGGNYSQTQNANQGGQFQTTGNTEQTQAQTVTGEQKNTGTTSGQTSQATTGTTTTTPTDTLGLGALLKAEAPTVAASDAARSDFLTDTMNTGGSQLGSQVDQAVRNSLSGEGMAGAGDSARARAAGYAGAQIGRNNMDQRLAASSQLAGGTGMSSLLGASTPLIGSSQTSSGNSLTNALQNNESTVNSIANTLGFSKLNETNAGSSAATSSQAAAGEIPQGQQVQTGSGGGCVLCTAAIELNLFHGLRLLRRVINHKLNTAWPSFRNAARGYFFLFTPVAKYLLHHRRLAQLLWPLAKMTVYEELRISGRRLPFKLVPWFVHWTGHGVCSLVGRLPVPGRVTDPTILELAQKHNILFTVKE